MAASKILLVDDEINILNALKRLLVPKNFDITVTVSPFEALHLASQEEFAVILSDHRMPHMEGTLLLQKMKEISPASIRILLTGYADMNAAIAAINEGEVYRFLSKPWNDEELVKILKQAVEQFAITKDQKELSTQNGELKKKNELLTAKSLDQVFENKSLYEKLDQSYLTAILALAKSFKIYDAGLWHHSVTVKMICQKISKLIRLSQEKAFQLEVAALLHDIGKMGIPQTILRKPEKMLTLEEKELCQGHPLNGYTIISQIPYFQDAALYVRYHHEHFDGTGYPDGLKTADIPTGARIIAVVDAYAKLKKGRPLNLDDSYQQAIAFLERQSGTYFDPDAVNLLKECIAFETETVPEESPRRQTIVNQWQQAITSETSNAASTNLMSAEKLPLKKSLQDEDALLFDSVDMLHADLETMDILPYTERLNGNRTQDSGAVFILDDGMMPQQQEESYTEPLSTINDPIIDWHFSEILRKTSESKTVPTETEVTAPVIQSKDSTESKTVPMETEVTAPVIQSKDSIVLPLTAKKSSGQPVSYGPGLADRTTAYYSAQNGKTLKQAYHQQTQRKYKEVPIRPSYLCAGMILSRDLMTPQGVKLLQKGTIIHPDQLDGLKSYLDHNKLLDLEIFILKPS